ncbi:MAG: hypothetical protein LBQ05_00505 [Christensenellaceae bacterium]|nr:hypothetical protein [Christensenellaceae bacterium]
MILSAALQNLLNHLRKLCPDDGYKIIEWAEFDGGEPDTVLAQLRELADLELVIVKYNDESVVCVAITPTGRVLEDKVKINGIIAKKTNSGDFNFGLYMGLILFAGAFLGGFLGAFLANML